MTRAVIVEDEPLSLMYLKSLLTEGFPDIEIVGTAADREAALAIIAAEKPDLVFLDIELRSGTGIEVALGLEGEVPDLIFTTALDKHATNLLRSTGIPFIQKPIDYDTLAGTLNKLRNASDPSFQSGALAHLRLAMQHGGIPQFLLIGDQTRFIALQDIVAIEARDTTSAIHLHSGETVHEGQQLRELDVQLDGCGFFRSHIHWLLNLRHVEEVHSDSVRMSDRNRVPVSAKKMDALRDALPR